MLPFSISLIVFATVAASYPANTAPDNATELGSMYPVRGVDLYVDQWHKLTYLPRPFGETQLLLKKTDITDTATTGMHDLYDLMNKPDPPDRFVPDKRGVEGGRFVYPSSDVQITFRLEPLFPTKLDVAYLILKGIKEAARRKNYVEEAWIQFWDTKPRSYASHGVILANVDMTRLTLRDEVAGTQVS